MAPHTFQPGKPPPGHPKAAKNLMDEIPRNNAPCIRPSDNLEDNEPANDSQPYIDDDPLKNLLDSSIKIIGDAEDSLPEELQGFLAEHDFGKRYFQVILKRRDNTSDDKTSASSMSYVKSWYRTIPSMEHLVKNYGPGDYMFVVRWNQKNSETGRVEKRGENIDFTISDKCQSEYDEFQYQKHIESRKVAQDKIRQLKVNKQLDDSLLGNAEQPEDKTTAKEYVNEIVEMAGKLGLTRESGGFFQTLSALAPLLIPVVTEFIKSQQNSAIQSQTMFSNMLGIMLGQSEKSNQHLLEFVKVSQGAGSGASSVKEFKDMLHGVIDIKEALNQKESVVDKVFTMVESVLPQVLSIMALNKQQQAQDYRVQMARTFVKANPDFKQVVGDPSKMAEFIARWDDHYGWEQTDGILSVIGIERPPECPHDPAKQKPINERQQPTEGVYHEQDNGQSDTQQAIAASGT